ncbi:thioredoxin family protein [Pseudenhygromyxa sp. WMMC2535]|nr:thioredoxin family protein [Pseudenhygromyxa sp. WMMC2535]
MLGTGCPAPPQTSDQSEPAPASVAATSRPNAGPEFVLAPEEGEVAALVLAERERTSAAGQRLLVYVGASWCEPCQAFHEAVEAGRYDEVFPDLRLLEFDLDRDRERLTAAGCRSKLIPLFALPGPDGHCGSARMEGGIKGPEAAENIRGRLESLLAATP